MYHFDESRCGCTAFLDNNNLNLKMLSIHSILIHCEKYFLKHLNFDGISDFYDIKLLDNFTFFVFVEFQHASQHKVKRFVAECSLLDFFNHLKNTFNLNKMFDISIRMMCQDEFELWVLSKIWGDTDFELIGGWKYWNDVKRRENDEYKKYH